MRVRFAVTQAGCDGVRQLNFAAHAALTVAERFKNFRFQYIASDHGHVGRRILRIRLFDDFPHDGGSRLRIVHADDAVLIRFFMPYVLHRKDAAAPHVRTGFDQLTQGRRLRIHQVVRKNDAEGFIPHDGSGTEHGMSQPQRLRLTDEDEIHTGGRHGMHEIEQRRLPLFRQIVFQFRTLVEMIFDGTLIAARNKDHVGHTRCGRFFHGVLNEGLIHDGKHFFRHCLRSRQKTRAETGHGEHDFAYGFHLY